MTENTSQARRYREMVRVCFYKTEPFFESASDLTFYEYLKSKYEEVKSRLSNLFSESAPESAIESQKSGLFVISVGLLTFGCLDVAQDILDNIPGGRANINRLAWVLNVLLPMPKGLDVLKEPTAVREWLNVKLSRLKWDESLEKYILENFRILTGVPIDSNPKQFNVPDNGISQKGLIVEILPDTGSNWVGNFQPGQSDFSGVYQHPNSIDLIIVSRGQGYIINPENRQLLETFGGCIFSVINLPETYYILFQDASSLLCYDSSGFLWQNTEIAWDSLRGIKVDGNILSGEFHRSNEDVWASFWLNIKTGSVHRGEYSLPLTKPTRPWWQLW